MPLFKSPQRSLSPLALSLLAFVLCCLFHPGLVQATGTLLGENQLLSVNIAKTGVAPMVDIRTKNPIGNSYSIYDAFSPLRVVIDLPGMDVSGMDVEGLTTPFKVNMTPVKDINVSFFNLTSGKLGRIEVLMAKASEHYVTLSENNCNLYVYFGPKPSQPASENLPEKPAEQKEGSKKEKKHLPLMGASSTDKSILSTLIAR